MRDGSTSAGYRPKFCILPSAFILLYITNQISTSKNEKTITTNFMHEPIYYTATSLLIFTRERRLKRIKCPFRVMPLMETEDFRQSAIYFVTRVFPHPTHRLVYEIEGKKYPYNTFQILLLEDLPQ